MDAIEAILSRRSIRKYTAENIPEPILQTILRSGMNAPSAGNQQPWQFIVINDKSILQQIPSIHPYSGMAAEAPLAILVCGDEKLEKHKGFWMQDCSAAIENMLITIRAYGLGAVWVGIFPREERVEGFKKLFGLPSNILPLALIPIGHPAETKPNIDRYDASRIHYNKW